MQVFPKQHSLEYKSNLKFFNFLFFCFAAGKMGEINFSIVACVMPGITKVNFEQCENFAGATT